MDQTLESERERKCEQMPTQTWDRETNICECLAELRAFARGGEPGLARLEQVWPSIKKHYRIKDEDEPGLFWTAKITIYDR